MRDAATGLAKLGAALRLEGVGTSLRDELDAAEGLLFVDGSDREEVRRTLRIALKIPRSAYETFDGLFEVFWGGEVKRAPRPPARVEPERPRSSRALLWDPSARRMGDAPGSSRSGDDPGYSPESVLRRKSFDEPFSPRDAVMMERLLARLARRLATRRSRRLAPTRGRGKEDIRSSYTMAMKTAGEMVKVARKAHPIEEPRLVFLVDTSGSMDAHSRFLLSFVLSLRRAVPTARAFAFSTRLSPLANALLKGKPSLTLERLFAEVSDWSGGTRIGSCLQAFAREHLHKVVNSRTVVVVLSDGLDRGEPILLADALRAIKERARKIIWLNPLMGDSRYEPLATGMQAALPFVDHLASAHDLPSFERLLPHLRS